MIHKSWSDRGLRFLSIINYRYWMEDLSLNKCLLSFLWRQYTPLLWLCCTLTGILQNYARNIVFSTLFNILQHVCLSEKDWAEKLHPQLEQANAIVQGAPWKHVWTEIRGQIVVMNFRTVDSSDTEEKYNNAVVLSILKNWNHCK